MLKGLQNNHAARVSLQTSGPVCGGSLPVTMAAASTSGEFAMVMMNVVITPMNAGVMEEVGSGRTWRNHGNLFGFLCNKKSGLLLTEGLLQEIYHALTNMYKRFIKMY